MADEIIEELWAVKDTLAKEHRYDLDALVAYLQAKAESDVSSDRNSRSEIIARPSS